MKNKLIRAIEKRVSDLDKCTVGELFDSDGHKAVF